MRYFKNLMGIFGGLIWGEASDCHGGGAGLAGSKGRAQAPSGVKGQSRAFAFDSVTCVRPDRTLMRRNRTA